MRWLVFGEGALGGLIAAKLHQQHQQVAVQTRTGAAPRPFIFDQQSTIELPAYTTAYQPDVMLAALKAYDVENWLAQRQQHPEWQHLPAIVSYNGMLDNEADLLPHDLVHWVTTHGAYRDSAHLVHAGTGESWLGSQQAGGKAPQKLLSILEKSLPPMQWVVDIQQRRWHKLAINCLINPLTVIYHCRNGELLEHPIAAPHYQMAVELVALARCFGLNWTADDLVTAALKVIRATAKNRSSMLSDIVQHRRTEIDFLNGFVAKQSEQRGLSAPTHQWLWEQVREIEAND